MAKNKGMRQNQARKGNSKEGKQRKKRIPEEIEGIKKWARFFLVTDSIKGSIRVRWDRLILKKHEYSVLKLKFQGFNWF
jgi:hypothetical protein